MFIFIGVSPIVIAIVLVALVLNAHITAGALIAMLAIICGAAVLATWGAVYIAKRMNAGLNAGYQPAMSRGQATRNGIIEWIPAHYLDESGQPRELTEAQIVAAAAYLQNVYGAKASLAELRPGGNEHE